MRRAKYYTGQKIGKLQVIKRAPDKINASGHPVIMWECQCECGDVVYRCSAHLKRGRCICHKCKAIEEHKKFGFEDIRAHHWYNIKKYAIKRNLEFNISMEYAWGVFEKQQGRCALSDLPIWFAKTRKEHATGGTTASLDRIDSSKGYVEGNVQWVHKWINVMKSDHTEAEFLYYCEQVVNKQRKTR
jgi:hypothetical protein